MKVITLGSGGWIPTNKRHTACYLIDTGESLIILDTGTGLSRLPDYKGILEKYNEVNIIYSHYHLDHLMGIVYLSNWAKNKKVNIFGPGRELGFQSCKTVLSDLLKPPYFVDINSIYKELEIVDYNLQGFQIGNLKISITKQIHKGGSFGITLGNKLHYATDTIECEETFKKAQRAKLLLHDFWSLEPEDNNEHSSLAGIKNMLKKFDVVRTGLIHINPNWNQETIEKLSQAILDESIFIAEDNMIFNL